MILEKTNNKHNVTAHKSLASSISAKIENIRKETLRSSFENYFNKVHRLQFVATVGSVDFIDDSKAENINATWYSIEEMIKPVIWIVGGNDENNDYYKLKNSVANKVRCIVYYGNNVDNILNNFQFFVDKVVLSNSLEDAVLKAYTNSEKGDVVLFSPSCSDKLSFQEKGELYLRAINKL